MSLKESRREVKSEKESRREECSSSELGLGED